MAALKFIIGYIRKSTDTEDKQVRSLEDQERLVIEFYDNLPEEERGYSLKIMSEARSAYRPGRPIFNEIVKMADTGQVHRIIVLDPTRLSRNMEDGGKIVQRLADGVISDIATITGNKRYSSEDTSQLFMLMLESTMSWKDSADKGNRVKLTMKQKAKEGGTTGPAPIGYRNVGEVRGKRWMEPDPATAPMVKRLFVLAATGAYSLEALTVEAQKLGLRTRPTQRHPNGLTVQKTTMHHIMRNTAYKGVKLYQGEQYPAKHIPLVQPDLWHRVQLELRSRSKQGARPKNLSLRDLFIMAGCVRCGVCKKRALSPYKVKGGKYIIYECKNPKTKCRNNINQDELLKQLYEKIEMLHCDNGDYEFMRNSMRQIHEQETHNKRERRSALEKELQGIDQQITDVFMNIEEAKRLGVYDTVSMKLAQLRMRKEELNAAIQLIHEDSQEWIDHVIGCFDLVKLACRAIEVGSPEVRLAVLKALSSNYTVGGKKLVCDWLTPFSERSNEADSTKWLPRLDSNQ